MTAQRATSHRAYSLGSGCFRSTGFQRVYRTALTGSVTFVCRDRQAAMLPDIIAARHRAKLAQHGEDIC
jgi:hypothetical protein